MSNIEKIIEKVNRKPVSNNISFDDFSSYLIHYDFRKIRIRSSHHIFKHPSGAELSVPHHGKTVKAIYIRKALKLIESMEN